MKFLVLQHINIEHPGIFLKFMKEDNIKIDTVELDENEKIPNLDPYDAMIVMGGPMDTWQEEAYPWLKPEKEAIHKFTCVNKKPYLGLCLGAQLLRVVCISAKLFFYIFSNLLCFSSSIEIINPRGSLTERFPVSETINGYE